MSDQLTSKRKQVEDAESEDEQVKVVKRSKPTKNDHDNQDKEKHTKEEKKDDSEEEEEEEKEDKIVAKKILGEELESIEKKPSGASDEEGSDGISDGEIDTLDTSLIIPGGRRTRGARIDYKQFGADPEGEE